MKAPGDSHRKNVLCVSLGSALQHFELSQLSSELVWFRFPIFLSYEAQYEPLLLKELLSFYCSTRRRLIFAKRNHKTDARKLRKRSVQHPAIVWINLFLDFCFGQHENPNYLDCLNPKNVWLKGTQPNMTYKQTFC